MIIDLCPTSIVLPGLILPSEVDRLPSANVIIYDGKCGFCTWSLAQVLASAKSGVSVVPFQYLSDTQINNLGSSRDATSKMLHFITSNSTVLTGADAFNELLQANAYCSIAIYFIRRLRWLLSAERMAYRWIAKNRVVISKILGTSQCAIVD